MAYLLVMPSADEGCGIALLEGWSREPAIGLDVAGARNALADGELGTAVSEGEDLAAAIARLLALPRSDAVALSHAVRARFGGPVFRPQVGIWVWSAL
jgi:phosphatidylinositol alpha-1,6-mannosyltransferase